MQLAMAICLFSAAYALNTEGYFLFSLLAFAAGAFVSATHDIAADGFYMLALSKESQALFVGIRATFYRLAMIFGSGLLVYTAGRIETLTGSIPLSWTAVIGAAGLYSSLCRCTTHLRFPFLLQTANALKGSTRADVPFLEIFRSYFKQEKIGAIIAFILLYRFAEAMLLKLAPPFYWIPKARAALDFRPQVGPGRTAQSGWPVSLREESSEDGSYQSSGPESASGPWHSTLHFPDLFYVYMAYAQPDIGLTCVLVALEQFGLRAWDSQRSWYIMYASRADTKHPHFAISTGDTASDDAAGTHQRLYPAGSRIQNVLCHRLRPRNPRHTDHPVHS